MTVEKFDAQIKAGILEAVGGRLEQVHFIALEIAKIDRAIEMLQERRKQVKETYQMACRNFEETIGDAGMMGALDIDAKQLASAALRKASLKDK